MTVDPQLLSRIFQEALASHRSGRLDDAVRLYRQILTVSPGHPDALHLLGVVALQRGNYAQAIDLIQQALSLVSNPGAQVAPYFSNLAQAYHEQGSFDAAIGAAQRALQLAPAFTDASTNLVRTLTAVNRPADALAVAERHLKVVPRDADMHLHRGFLLLQLNKPEDAIAGIRESLKLRPGYPKALLNLGSALHANGELDEALAAFRHALELHPDFALAHSGIIYALLFHPKATAMSIKAEADAWEQRHASRFRTNLALPANERAPDRPLRVGYVSSDFGDHVVGRNVLPVLRQHDRSQCRIYLYSSMQRNDDMARVFQGIADVWRDISTLSDDAAAALIRQDQIDILVDLSLHMAGNRLLLFARKPAPLQFTFAGYPGTTGLKAIDYRFTDPYLDPPALPGEPDPADGFYTEKSIRLPHSFWVYDPLETRDIEVSELPAGRNNVVTFGCLNSSYKVNPQAIALWTRVLKALPGAQFIMMGHEGSFRRRVLKEFEAQGVTADRIRFFESLPRAKYLRLYHEIDIALDSLPYNAHTTGLDALWMGVPTITLVGQTVVGRAGYSQLMNLGLQEFAAHSETEFLAIAVGLAHDLPRLAELRRTLRSRLLASPLGDAQSLTRALESHFRQAWQNFCGRSPS